MSKNRIFDSILMIILRIMKVKSLWRVISMIDVMINHLVMPDDELEKYSGLGTLQVRLQVENSK